MLGPRRSSWTLDPGVPGRRWSEGGPACGIRGGGPRLESYGSRDPTRREKEEKIIDKLI